MVKYIVEGSKAVIESSGNTCDLCADIALIINSVYSAIKSNDTADSERFRELLIKSVSDRSSPIWTINSQMSGLVVRTPKREKEGI